MNDMRHKFSVDLNSLASAYEYDANSFAPLYAALTEKIAAYDETFGPYLIAHLSRVAHDTEHFMIAQGYDSDTAQKIGHAFALHDIGKIKQDPDLWRLTIDKRDLSAEQKLERTKHTDLGIEVLNETVAELDMDLTNAQKSHLEIVKYLMLYHHERLDGTGPKAMPALAMDNILRITAIIDTVDGKTKAKGLTEIFDDMSGAKHAGQFDDALVAAYATYYKDHRPSQKAVGQPVLANTPQSL